MAMNAGNTIIPGRGAVFIAPVGTPIPDYNTINPNLDTGAWKSVGHTSRDNAVSLTQDGGESETRGSWWDDSIATTTSPVTRTLTVNTLEIGAEQLNLAFNGQLETDSVTGSYKVPAAILPTEQAVFVLAVQGSKRLGVYFSRVSLSVGEMPTFDPESFFEIQLVGQILVDNDGEYINILHESLDKTP